MLEEFLLQNSLKTAPFLRLYQTLTKLLTDHAVADKDQMLFAVPYPPLEETSSKTEKKRFDKKIYTHPCNVNSFY